MDEDRVYVTLGKVIEDRLIGPPAIIRDEHGAMFLAPGAVVVI